MSDTVSACSDVPNVVISVGEELAKDVDGHYAKATIRFNLKDRHDRFV